jgi:hypothetical protein
MQIVTLSNKARQLEERKRALGIAPARFEAARNKGGNRTASKRALLGLLKQEARRQGRELPFAANF